MPYQDEMFRRTNGELVCLSHKVGREDYDPTQPSMRLYSGHEGGVFRELSIDHKSVQRFRDGGTLKFRTNEGDFHRPTYLQWGKNAEMNPPSLGEFRMEKVDPSGFVVTHSGESITIEPAHAPAPRV